MRSVRFARFGFVVSLMAALMLAGCAAKERSASASASASADAKAERAAKKAPTAPPADSPLARISNGMSDSEVRRLLGEPDGIKDYETGKRWIPGSRVSGQDVHRREYTYRGKGRITFARNEYSQNLRVIRVDYDPDI